LDINASVSLSVMIDIIKMFHLGDQVRLSLLVKDLTAESGSTPVPAIGHPVILGLGHF
jgi:hypothetical protein